MFPFWESVVAPLVTASGARRIVEIGALRGETTSLMLDALGPDAELHVVDPVPEFDPTEHERRFPGRYVFHRDLSLNVLPEVGAFDVALIDGDHNWYTVVNELRILRASARREHRPLPVLVLHDVAWPYGRRDLYYEPSQIPEEHRQPYARRGMRPDRKELLRAGGMNVTLDNAIVEGGPRNGVMTALDDFIAEHDEPLRNVVIPIYFGLAIVAEQRVVDEHPALAELLDSFETTDGKQRLLELSEQIRIDATVFEHNIARVRDEQLTAAVDRYLSLLRAALLDEHYLENEVRIGYLLERVTSGLPAHSDQLRAPESFLRKELAALRQARSAGADETELSSGYFPYTEMGSVKLADLHDALCSVRAGSVPGDLVECAPGRGGAGVYLRGFLEAYGLADRDVWVAGRFRATPLGADPSHRVEQVDVGDLLTDVTQVQEAFSRFDLLDERVRFLQGAPAAALADAPIDRVALLRIGAGVGSDARPILDLLYDRVSPGGAIVFEDLADEESRSAVDEFCRDRGISPVVEHSGWSGEIWHKDDAPATPRMAEVAADAGGHVPLAPSLPRDAIDLSVIVVFYNMRREAARTLHSLSRAYQRGIDDLHYEVIVMENGSDEDQRLGEDFVRAFGPEFRYVDLGESATPSPIDALNRAIKLARGRAFALLIDGAHVLTPGVLRYGMIGLRSYGPAVVATQQWYVGPGQQPVAVDAGYDQVREDELFDAIDWPSDGYQLFDIGHFIGDRDWFDGILESNCLFVPRALVEQLGGFDQSFSMPGGGYANLDLWERMASAPEVAMVSILGEGSFHQVHGGTTTNDGEHVDRRTKVFAYGQHYEDLRGRLLRGPAKPMHYVGTLAVDGARRTRSRRTIAPAFRQKRTTDGPDGVPSVPDPLPDDLRSTMIETFWKGLSWKDSSWLGDPISAAPTDLFVYQELLTLLRPDWIVETGTAGGGRARFLASICDLLGQGRVVSVSDDRRPRPAHPRITYVEAPPHTQHAVAQVCELTGEEPHAMVILGSSGGAPRIVQEFSGYSPLVPIGSYVVVENTIVNGHPVWPGYGPGPTEAVRRILALFGGWVQDTSWEKHGITFHPGGFLRRIG